MDLKHDLVYSRSAGGGEMVKAEPRLHSPPGEPGGSGSVLFYQATKRRVDDWLSSPSPTAHAPALTPSPGEPNHPYTVISNGYSSPTMSSGSYDPYSPNGKIGEYIYTCYL